MRASRVAALLVLAPMFAAAQQAPNRSRPPALAAPPPLTLPSIEKREIKNGLDVWLVEAHEVPLVQVNLVIHAGSGDDPPGAYGLASLTAAMLDEGAGDRDALQIADEVEFLGAELSTTSSFDASAVRLNVPVSALPPALSIMADVVLEPTFPTDELERLREERLLRLEVPEEGDLVDAGRVGDAPSRRAAEAVLGVHTSGGGENSVLAFHGGPKNVAPTGF